MHFPRQISQNLIIIDLDHSDRVAISAIGPAIGFCDLAFQTASGRWSADECGAEAKGIT